MMNLVLALAVILAASVLAWAMIQRGQFISPMALFVIAIWAACGIVSPPSGPLFQSSIQITKNTASEAAKDNP